MLLSTMSPQQIAAIKAPLVQDYLKKNKNYRELYKKNYNEDPFENAGSGGNTNVDLNNYFIKEFDSIAEANRKTSIAASNISACCKGKHKHAGGYIWKFN